MTKKWTKESLLAAYVELAHKLGKIPTQREVLNFVCSNDTFVKYYGSFAALKDAALETHPNLEQLKVPARVTLGDVESYRLNLESKKIKKENKGTVQLGSNWEYVKDIADKVFSGKITVQQKSFKKKKTQRVLNLVLSDLHIGADIDGGETDSDTFGINEESRRLAKVIQETIGFKRDHRDETELNVFLLGDIIQGDLKHDPRDGAELTEQYCRALHLLGQAFGILASEFKSVKILCCSGNHDRNVSRHPGRAIHGRYDSFATMIYYSLQKMMQNVPNVKFVIPKTLHVVAENFGKKLFAWHGDTGIKTGYVGSAINVSNIEKGMNRINASLKDSDEYGAFICGHLHTGTVVFLSNGASLIVNGGLPPVDSFGTSLGMTESNSGQMLFESVPDVLVGDVRFIRVSAEDDENNELDKLIKPWNNYNE